ncbi:TapB family protein [Candidatus Uabimicrobium amorphum]|uniref:DUF3108 domain-containing protein n=1 Tax=Uabimicrobium amorphum TaxID=2596890 RepID=A0A5S9IIG1_UABAM|nr:hypothetical protein [Candidatus Uabimicrobium amorphum]BBM81982.1 hypothetical protein UABAM_00325 [Candidatus Uabimicrobium amorphum]
MKYFWALVIIILSIIAGGHVIDYKALYLKYQGIESESEKQSHSDLDNKIAYSFLEAMAQAEAFVQEHSSQEIRYITRNEKGEPKVHRHEFSSSDYMELTPTQKVLKGKSLRKFYYKLDNLIIKELPNEMRSDVHGKLKERYEFVKNTAETIHNQLMAKKKTTARLNKEQQQAQKMLQQKQREISEMENKRREAQELLQKKQREMLALEKKKREMEKFFHEKKEQANSLEKEKSKVEKMLEKKRLQAKALEKKKKEAEKYLLQSQKEAEKYLLQSQKEALLLKKQRQEAAEHLRKQKNIVTHQLFPIGKGFFWKYRVKKYIDKNISYITFSTKKQGGKIFLQDNKKNKHPIEYVDGFILQNGAKVLPCSVNTKTWEKGGYSVEIHDNEWVSTDAGSFYCVVIHAALKQNSDNVIKEYYAPQIGKVKQTRFVGGKKIYEQILVDYKTNAEREQLNRSKPFPQDATFFPVNSRRIWEYEVLKLEENRIASMRWELNRENGQWKLKDNSNYAPSIAVAEGFVLRGLQKIVPLHAKNPETWQRGQFNVYISHFGEIVTTEMGNFECLVVVAKHKKKEGYIIKEYYADKVGEVKSEIYHHRKKIYSRVLRKFK